MMARVHEVDRGEMNSMMKLYYKLRWFYYRLCAMWANKRYLTNEEFEEIRRGN